jgi:hypothetical protein
MIPSEGDRSLNKNFRIRARVKCGSGQFKTERPEFPPSTDPADRFTSKPPLNICLKQTVHVIGPAVYILMRQNRAVTPQSKAQQQTCILPRTGNASLCQSGRSRPENCPRFGGHTHLTSPQIFMPDDRSNPTCYSTPSAKRRA